MKKILVTDTLFIFDDHVKQLEAAGYEVVRVEKPDMDEAELVEAVKGKVGYILGGTEYVTEPVINAATDLEAIVFTGTGFKGHIPAWELAISKGIKIGTTPYANVYEVAEWGLAATLAMQRDLFSLGSNGTDRFHTIVSLPDLNIGVVGMGHIGEQYADMMHALGAKSVSYWSRNHKNVEYQYSEKEHLFKNSDIIFVAIGDEAGENFISYADLDNMKQGALLVSIAHRGIINEDDLSRTLKAGRIRAALDVVKEQSLFEGLSPRIWYASKASAAYNSYGYLKRSSDMAVNALINLLTHREDENAV